MKCWVLAIVSHEIHDGQWLHACMNIQISWGLQLLSWVGWLFFFSSTGTPHGLYS